LRKYNVNDTRLPFGVKQRFLPLQLTHKIELYGKFGINRREKKIYHPNNILCIFGKPSLSYKYSLITETPIPGNWILVFHFNHSVCAKEAFQDFTNWLSAVLAYY
jgi:hypothetical protein